MISTTGSQKKTNRSLSMRLRMERAVNKGHLLGAVVLTLLLTSCGQPAASPAATPALGAAPQEPAASQAAEFTHAAPESQEISPETLQELADIVNGYVQTDKVVGAELVVLKNRRIV